MVEFYFLFSFDFVIVSQRALNEHQQTYKDKQKGKTINCSVSPAVSPQLLRNSELYRLYLNTSHISFKRGSNIRTKNQRDITQKVKISNPLKLPF